MIKFTEADRRSRLAQRHFLARHAATPEEVATGLVGLHSSDPTTVYLSCRARIEGFVRADVDRALYSDKTLLRVLGMRRTMFVLPPHLAGIVDAACTRKYVAAERKRLVGYLESQGVAIDGSAWLADVEQRTLQALEEAGEATATQLRRVVPELQAKLKYGGDKSWAGEVGVSTRILFLLATSGRIIRTRPLGTWISSQYRWASLSNWYAAGLQKHDVAAASSALVARWLEAFGPGTLTDIKWWTGWGIRATRGALESVGAVEVDLDGTTGFVLPNDLEPTLEAPPWVALLPALDPTVMGWKERSWYLGAHAAALFDRNGNAGPTIWCDGRVVGGWAQAPDGNIRIEVLERLGREERSAIDAHAAELADWFGESRITPRFRTPLEKRLLA
ncbi:MAG: winged helix DNA-binding domain-containing protein [Acidimicrobiia bacterium]|nr:winged helix DNA-binding domain-containing protein [Acidimicrobiia bacterium]